MLLLFFGLSMGVSVASMRMTSYSISLFRRAFRPGRAKSGYLMSVSSLKRVVKCISLALRVDARRTPPVKGEARAGVSARAARGLRSQSIIVAQESEACGCRALPTPPPSTPIMRSEVRLKGGQRGTWRQRMSPTCVMEAHYPA